MGYRCLGTGNTGMVLATEFSEDALLFSTARQDTINFVGYDVFSFSSEGASKRFKIGQKIWEDNEEKLREVLSNIKNEKIILFSSLGGGSGSSSLCSISKILLENNNRIFIIGILPYKSEVNPPLSNSIQAINSLIPIINKVSIILFDNEKLKKQFDSDWTKINHHIVKVTDYIVNLLKKYSIDKYSPLTLDQSELESVIFGGGFVDFSDTFLEEGNPKFEYGTLDKTTKNCLVAMFVDKNKKDDEMDLYHKIFTEVTDRVSRKCKNARFIPGILRGSLNKTNSENNINDRAYVSIVSGLNVEKYIKKLSKIRDSAVEKALAYSEQEKVNKILDSKDTRILDI
jgi:hypothetical protein